MPLLVLAVFVAIVVIGLDELLRRGGVERAPPGVDATVLAHFIARAGAVVHSPRAELTLTLTLASGRRRATRGEGGEELRARKQQRLVLLRIVPVAAVEHSEAVHTVLLHLLGLLLRRHRSRPCG